MFLGLLKKCKFLPQNIYVKYYYEYYTGKKLDLEKPIEFNQKIQWYKVYYHNPLLTKLVDKYTVREFVKDKIGDKYLNECYQVYDKVDDVNTDELPNRFVLKAVHGCNFNIIVKDVERLNRTKANFKMRKWMRRNQYYRGGLEWAYKNIPPKIIAEKYLKDGNKDVLIDYKFYCFDGVVKFLQVDIERGINDYRVFYDTNWNKLEFTKGVGILYEKELEKPINFDEMLNVASVLSEEFPFVRVDLYSINNATIFGEMTFYPGDGRQEFYPDKFNKIVGDYFKLPNVYLT